MGKRMTVGEQINKEYHKIQSGEQKDMSELYRLLYPYMSAVVSRVTDDNDGKLHKDVVEDVVQDALAKVFEKGFAGYEEDGAQFATYCGVIAKNKAVDWLRMQTRRKTDMVEEMGVFAEGGLGSGMFANPEARMIRMEQQLERIEYLKQCLHTFVNLNAKPYQLVSSGYAMFIFHKYFPQHKSLTYPQWAYEKLEKDTVRNGAASFLKEMNSWLPYVKLVWGDDFEENMNKTDKKKDRVVSELVFGAEFTEKDFENWCSRVRKKLLKEMNKALYEKHILATEAEL